VAPFARLGAETPWEGDDVEMATETIDLALAGRDRSDLLARVAVALGSTLELGEVLRLLAEMARDATAAQRCSVFLLEGRRLHPAASLGADLDTELWQAFQTMGRIELDAPQWEAVSTGRLVSFADAADSDGFVPLEWVERFDLGALALIPLMSHDEPVGLMALDWAERRPVSLDHLALLETIATYAGIAVANARLHLGLRTRGRLQEALIESAAALSSVLDGDELAARLADGCVRLVDPCLAGVGLLDVDRTRILRMALRAAREPESPLALDDIPGELVTRVWRAWERDKRPLEIRDEPFFVETLGGEASGAGWYLLVPLVVEEHTRGVVVLGFTTQRSLGSHERAAVEALAALAAAALERRVLVDRLARRSLQLDTLYRVSVALSGGADAQSLTDELNELLAGQAVDVRGLVLRDRRLARHLRGPEPTARERAAWRGGRWLPGSEWIALENGDLAAPMRLGRRLVGTLRVAPGDFDSEDRAFVEALARGLAEVAERDTLRTAVAEADREQALANERERMAADLHDTAGAAFVTIALAARRRADHLQAGSPTRDILLRLATVADEGKWEVDQAVRALAFVPATRRGLLSSLRALGRSVSSDSGIRVSVDSAGRTVRLKATVERALYRVAHEALVNAWRHARCTAVDLHLDVADAAVTLTVADDGVGLDGEPTVEHRGLAGMRRVLRGVDGDFSVSTRESGGTEVVARVSRR
jgi:signal transduction histidine kinase